MAEKAYFFSNSVILRILEGDERFKEFLSAKVSISFIQLYELNKALLARYGENIAKKAFNRLQGFCVSLKPRWVKEAAVLKLSHEGLSDENCIGYVIARNKKIRFLTVEQGFKGMENAVIV